MKRLFVVLRVVGIISLVFLGGRDTRSQQLSDFAENQIIVKMVDGVPRSLRDLVQNGVGASVTRRFSLIHAELWQISGLTVEEAIQQLSGDPSVEYAEPNYFVYATQIFPNDPDFDELYGLHNTGQTGGTPDADIDAPEAWQIGTGGDVLIGVIDSGTDWTHEDLAANIWTNPGEIPNNNIDDDGNGFTDDVRGWDFANNDNNPMDDHDRGHGTHVAGTIAAAGNNEIGVTGVSWSARIMPLKFLRGSGGGTTADAISAIEYATMMGAQLTNNSWGGSGFSVALRNTIEAAGQAGMLFIAAAGNAGADNDVDPHYPASYDLDNIISVAWTNHNDDLATSSNYGATTVDLGAPGNRIYSTMPGNDYGTLSGTSMAAPHVSGVAGLFWSKYPALSNLQVKEQILTSVDAIPALDGVTVSGGRLNAFKTMSQPETIPPSVVSDLATDSPTSNSITLSWTATGNDSTSGIAASYDVRYSLSQIDSDNFDLAIEAVGEPLPQPPGTPETFTVAGLDVSTTYYFALRVSDFWGNLSPVSNSPSGTTLGAPDISVSPASLSENLLTGETAVHTLTIQNVGEGTLDFGFSAPPWLSLDPDTGRVWFGEAAVVDVTVDATGLSGGDYVADLVVTSNDPDTPILTVPVDLHVTSAPDLVVSDTTVDFGLVPIGFTEVRTLVLSNVGAADLLVSEVTADHPDFVVESAGFALMPGENRELPVTFAPSVPGLVEGTLTLASNDPVVPMLAVSLLGKGVTPPDIDVSPQSLSATLSTGSTTTKTLTISNINSLGEDLLFTILEDTPGIAVNSVQSPPSPGNPAHRSESAARTNVSHKRNDIRSTGGIRSLASVADELGGRPRAPSFAETRTQQPAAATQSVSVSPSLRILLLHSAAELYTFQNALLAYPDISVVDTYDGEYTTPVLNDLLAYHVVIVIPDRPFDQPTVIGDLLADYVDAGGGVILAEGAFLNTFGVDFAIHGRFVDEGYTPFEIGVSFSGGLSLGTIHQLHTIMSCAEDAWTGLVTDTQLTPGAILVSSWENEQPFIATKGSRVVGANVLLVENENAIYWAQDIPLIIHNAALWATGFKGPCWASACPPTGTVPADNAVSITVTFDASAVCVSGGDHHDTLVVSSNDPDEPEVRVPLLLHVLPLPDIAVSHHTVDFGSTPIGFPKEKTIVVSNEGTDVLTVSDVVIDNSRFTADATAFVLAPGESQNLTVTFSPNATTLTEGTLEIWSNDPDEPVVDVLLQGEGSYAPEISIFPLELSDTLVIGETSTLTVTIENHGPTDLMFDVFEGTEVLSSEADKGGSSAESHDTASKGGQRPGGGRAHSAERGSNGSGLTPDIPRLTSLTEHLGDPGNQRALSGKSLPASGALNMVIGEPRRVLILHSVNNYASIQSLLAGFPDIAVVDAFDAYTVTPRFADLRPYHCVIAMNNLPYDDPEAVGDVLADYVDAGGGVVLTEGTFLIALGADFAIHGRLIDEGYSPYTIGFWYVGVGHMSSYDASHPLMRDVSSAFTALVTYCFLAPGAEWVASLDVGAPFVATKGVDVVGVNGFVEDRRNLFWAGDFPELLRNAALWVSGERIGWVSPNPVYETVAPGGSTPVTITLGADPSCVTEGLHVDTLVVRSNDPVESDVRIPVSLYIRSGQTIPLSVGWNLVSWNIDSEVDSTTTLLSDVMGDLAVALGFDGGGLTFSPDIPPQFNTLQTMDHVHGYWLNMTEPNDLRIVGDRVSPETPIELSEGWNLVSYLPDEPDSTTHALSSVLDKTVVVLGFDGAGLIYDPEIPPEFNSLTVMERGRGYWIKTTEPCSLVYPETSVHPSGPVAAAHKVASSGSTVTPTTEWMGIWGSGVVVGGTPIAIGTVVTALDDDGVVCGESIVTSAGKVGLMAVYKDDPGTPADEGAGVGEYVTLYAGDQLIADGIPWSGMGDVYEIADVVTAVSDQERPTQYELLQNHPNPFNPVTRIRYELPQPTTVRLVVYNVSGQLVRELVNENQPAGRHVAKWDGTNASGDLVSSGVYFYRIEMGTFVRTRKLVLLK